MYLWWFTIEQDFEGSFLLEYYAVSTGKQLPKFRRIIVPSSSGLNRALWLLDLENERTKNLVGHCLPVDTA